MADPSKYTQGYDFSEFSDSHPSTPLPGDRLDNELANVSHSTEELRDAIKDVRRSDGRLKNGIVTRESLSSSLSAMTGIDRGAWVTATAYVVGDLVTSSSRQYQCIVAHTSGVFATDLAAGKWALTAAESAEDAAESAAEAAASAAEAAATLAAKADLDSPAFTGVPTAPTAAAGTSSTQLATTAFVETALGGFHEVATIAALKALNGAAMVDGAVLYLRSGSTVGDGKEGFVIYRSSLSTTGDDAVYFTPADNTGRFVRKEWQERNELLVRWWGLVDNSSGSAAANGAAITAAFAFVQATTQVGTMKFPGGTFYVSMASTITLSKKHGWTFEGAGASSSGAGTGSSGTRLYLLGGGAGGFIRYRTVLQSKWRNIHFRVQTSSVFLVFDIGAENYYDVDGVTPIDATALSSYLNEWDNVFIYGDVAGGFGGSTTPFFFHAAVCNVLRNVWISGFDNVMRLGESVANEPRTLAKGACAQLLLENCLLDGDILVRNLFNFEMRGGQLSKPSGISAATRCARLVASSLGGCSAVSFRGVALGWNGDHSQPFVSGSLPIIGFSIDRACTMTGYSFAAVADGAATNWDVSPTLSVDDYSLWTGFVQITGTCTGKHIGSHTPKVSGITTMVSDLRASTTIRDQLYRKISRGVTVDLPSIAAGASVVSTISLIGAVPGLPCQAALTTAVAGLHHYAECTAADTVTIRTFNYSGSPIDATSGTLTAFQDVITAP